MRRGGEHTPDSDLVQSTHPFPIIQNDTVEERLREKDSERKGMCWEGGDQLIRGCCFYVCIVSTHTALDSNYIKRVI